MDYIKLFDLNSDYNNYIKAEDALLPNVSLVQETITLYYNPVIKNYFRFVAIEDSSILLSLIDYSAIPMSIEDNSIELTSTNTETDHIIDLQYSKDGMSWIQYDFNPIPLNAGETLYMKGNNPNGLSITNEYATEWICTFGNMRGDGTTGIYECHGNIMSLLYGDDFEDKTTIPVTGCFDSLFGGCDGLLTAPELPATTLSDSCYRRMFYSCTSLVNASALPATTLADYCYYEMFNDCVSLVNAPELPATTLANECYRYMFDGCSKLNNITMLATDISATDCLDDWVNYVSSTGTFTKHPDMTSLPNGTSGIPEGWTVVDYAA